MSIQNYRDLEAWQVGMDFVVQVYRLTARFPREEMYGLTGQLRRAAIGIPSNLSEGHQRGTKAYAHFVTVAIGSLAEAETHMEIARRVLLVSDTDLKNVHEVALSLRRLLFGLRRSLARKNSN